MGRAGMGGRTPRDSVIAVVVTILVKVVVLVLIVFEGQFAQVAVHHVALHGMQGGEALRLWLVHSCPNWHVTVLQLSTLRSIRRILRPRAIGCIRDS